jgi:glycerol-3-phosphate dehydrogenase (NAD(P)+)
VFELGERNGVDLPITGQVRAVLYEGVSPASAGQALMDRAATDELRGIGLIAD